MMDTRWHEIETSGTTCTPLSVRVYSNEGKVRTPPLVLYLRGGSFLAEGAQREELPVAKALAESGAVVIEADYSTGSCNEFPAVIDRAFDALDCLSNSRKQYGSAKSLLFVAGEEAGGNVAAGLALKARDRMPGKLAGQILLSPMIDPLMASTSFRDADKIGMRQRGPKAGADTWQRPVG